MTKRTSNSAANRSYGVRMALAALLLLASPAIPAPVQAAQISAEYLTQVCAHGKNGKETIKGGHITCQAYIAGVIDYHNIYRSSDAASPNADFCIPSSVELGDLQKVVYTYLRRNPQHQGFVAAPAVALSLFEAFPCQGR